MNLMQMAMGERRRTACALLALVAPTAALVAVVALATPARADAALSSVCELVDAPHLDDFSQGHTVFALNHFSEGDRVTVSAGPPTSGAPTPGLSVPATTRSPTGSRGI